MWARFKVFLIEHLIRIEGVDSQGRAYIRLLGMRGVWTRDKFVFDSQAIPIHAPCGVVK